MNLISQHLQVLRKTQESGRDDLSRRGRITKNGRELDPKVTMQILVKPTRRSSRKKRLPLLHQSVNQSLLCTAIRCSSVPEKTVTNNINMTKDLSGIYHILIRSTLILTVKLRMQLRWKRRSKKGRESLD